MSDKVFEANPKIDLNDCYLWQYEQAEKLKKILQNKQAFLDKNVKQFWDDWVKNVFT